ncbi:MAG: ribonuclease III family protein [Candidatus Baldrarchaeia archaeon]
MQGNFLIKTLFQLRELKTYESIRQVFRDKELASFGDACINFLYSLALSYVKKTPMGGRVPNKVLSEALNRSELRSCVPKRLDSHERGDVVEALIAYALINGIMTFDEVFNILVEGLSGLALKSDRKEAWDILITTFEKLLEELSARIFFHLLASEKFKLSNDKP